MAGATKFSIVLFFVLVGCAFARNSELMKMALANNSLARTNMGLIEELAKKVENHGCHVNICFALDGSASLANDFDTQKNFVKLITAIVGFDPRAKFAGTTYGLVNSDISPLTSDAMNFFQQVCDAPFPNAPGTLISAGLAFCINQLDGPDLRHDVNKIVLLGDGRSTFGGTGPLSPAVISQGWRDLYPNNRVCAVAVGFADTTALEAITGDPSLVLEVNQWFALLNILDALVSEICDSPKPSKSASNTPTVTPTPSVTASPSVSASVTPSTSAIRCPCTCRTVTVGGIRDAQAARQLAMADCQGLAPTCRVRNCGEDAFHCCEPGNGR